MFRHKHAIILITFVIMLISPVNGESGNSIRTVISLDGPWKYINKINQ